MSFANILLLGEAASSLSPRLPSQGFLLNGSSLTQECGRTLGPAAPPGPQSLKHWSSQPLSSQMNWGHSLLHLSSWTQPRSDGAGARAPSQDTHWGLIALLASYLLPSPSLFFLQGLEKRAFLLIICSPNLFCFKPGL